MNEIIYIVTTDKYPEGDAGAIRSHAFAKIFQQLGYTPIVVGLGKNTNFSLKEYDGIQYYSLRYSSPKLLWKIAQRLLFLCHLKKIFRRHGLDSAKGIMYVSGDKATLNYIKKMQKRKKIALYYDSVEWFSPSEFKNGEKNWYYKLNDRLNKVYIDSAFKVFSISSYLEKHFNEREIRTLRIPVIMDTEKIGSKKQLDGNYVNIVYAGQMGKKDKIPYFISALSRLTPQELARIQMYVIGVTLEQYESQFGEISSVIKNKNILFMGRLSREKTLEYLKKANFTMLLRPENERYAQAGFPTKVVESLAMSTPVICNYTSDLKEYLRDMENSLIVRDCSIEACTEALRRALNVSQADQVKMQATARKTAEKHFDYRDYVSAVSNFL